MKKIDIGQTYGKLSVLSANNEKYYKRYNCRCECGRLVAYTGHEIQLYQYRGCHDCMVADKDSKRLDNAKLSIGIRSGELEVISVAGIRYYDSRNTLFVHCRCDCGNEIDVPLSRIKARQVKSCGHNTAKNLEYGIDVTRKGTVCGTRIAAIDGRRKTNKNSSTKYTGISYMPKYKKYRAYISFQNKQYHLGMYEDINDAISARKQAEKKIYGGFLEKYYNKKECDKACTEEG